jgi:hypothetical protein
VDIISMTKNTKNKKTPKGKKSSGSKSGPKSGKKSGSKSHSTKVSHASPSSDSDSAADVSHQPSRAASPSGASTNNDFDVDSPTLSPSHPQSRERDEVPFNPLSQDEAPFNPMSQDEAPFDPLLQDEAPSNVLSPSGEEHSKLLRSDELAASPHRNQTLSDDDVQFLGTVPRPASPALHGSAGKSRAENFFPASAVGISENVAISQCVNDEPVLSSSNPTNEC